MLSKYAARIAQALTATNPSMKIRSDQWEGQPDLGERRDGVGTISLLFRDMIWEQMCKASPHLKGGVLPFAFQIWISRIQRSRRGGPQTSRHQDTLARVVHDVDEAEFEIARSLGYPNPVHLNRFMVPVCL